LARIKVLKDQGSPDLAGLYSLASSGCGVFQSSPMPLNWPRAEHAAFLIQQLCSSSVAAILVIFIMRASHGRRPDVPAEEMAVNILLKNLNLFLHLPETAYWVPLLLDHVRQRREIGAGPVLQGHLL